MQGGTDFILRDAGMSKMYLPVALARRTDDTRACSGSADASRTVCPTVSLPVPRDTHAWPLGFAHTARTRVWKMCAASALRRDRTQVIRADLALEETYTAPPAAASGVPIVAVIGSKVGRDKEKSVVSRANAGLWAGSSTAAGSKVVVLDALDWYVLQEADGARAVLAEVANGMPA